MMINSDSIPTEYPKKVQQKSSPRRSPQKMTLEEIEKRENEIKNELIELLTPQRKELNRHSQKIDSARKEHEARMQKMQFDFEEEEAALTREENLLLQDLADLEEDSARLHGELETVIEEGEEELNNYKEEQATIHAKMSATIDSTTRLIDDALTEHNEERESIRREFIIIY